MRWGIRNKRRKQLIYLLTRKTFKVTKSSFQISCSLRRRRFFSIFIAICFHFLVFASCSAMKQSAVNFRTFHRFGSLRLTFYHWIIVLFVKKQQKNNVWNKRIYDHRCEKNIMRECFNDSRWKLLSKSFSPSNFFHVTKFWYKSSINF